MQEDILKECLSLRERIIMNCNNIGKVNPACYSMMRVVVENLDTEDAFKTFSEEVLTSKLAMLRDVYKKTEKVLDEVKTGFNKPDRIAVDIEVEKRRIMMGIILNKIFFVRDLVLGLFKK